ncbi:small nuclear ribonucleoprotein G [Enteropsectra breve]|nr:small nuclear ribonucleoprotein G [Enteropsectra breve]
MELEPREFEKYLNKNVVVAIWGDAWVSGILKSYDQYNTISLNYATEFRKDGGNRVLKKSLGLIVLRGENIICIGIAQLGLGEGML